MKKSNYALACCIGILIFQSCSNDAPNLVETSTISSNETTQKSSIEVTAADINNVINSMTAEWGRNNSRSNEYELKTIYKNGEPCIYIINFDNNNGFIAISASKSYYPILAYSKEGNFITNNSMPGALTEWINGTVQSVENSKELPTDSISKYIQLWQTLSYNEDLVINPRQTKHSRADIDITDEEYQELLQIVADAKQQYKNEGHNVYPLSYEGTGNSVDDMMTLAEESIYPMYDHVYESLSFIVEYDSVRIDKVNDFLGAKWDQENGFNASFPKVNGVTPPAGCGPIAVAQVMYYKKSPSTIDWSSMNASTATTTCADFIYEVAKRAKYTTNGTETGTTISNLVSTLKSYSHSCNTASHNATSSKSEISNKMPVIFTSSTDTFKHAWVACGYYEYWNEIKYVYYTLTNRKKIGTFHQSSNITYYLQFYMNWGWGGRNDGFYLDSQLRSPLDNTSISSGDRTDIINIR